MSGKLARSHRTRSPDAPRTMLKVGDLLANKYRVERILGEGGMGVVAAAYHELLDQWVAVKLLYHDIADREAQSRLLLEARSAAKLRSDHVAHVIDVDVGLDGLPFIVMELLEGADLAQILDARGPLPGWVVADYMLQTLDGLAHAHARGIIHRDLKPSNLFLTELPENKQIIKILDFGISKSQGVAGDRVDRAITGGRGIVGSPPYMSPEQIRTPKDIDFRADVWSLGVSMYELLTDSMPFGGDELQETFAEILEKDPVPIRELVPSIHADLEAVVMRCLSKKPKHRYRDVAELATALKRHGSGEWSHVPDRVEATLVRGITEEMTTGSRRLSGLLPQGTPRAPESARKPDAMPPELTGTAATVAVRFSLLESRRPWIFGAFALTGAVILAFIALTALRKQAPSPPAMAFAPPLESVDLAAETSPEVPAPSVAEAIAPAPTSTAVATAAARAKPAPRTAPPPPRPASKPAGGYATPPGGYALPAGLPQTRSGQ